MFEMGNFFKAKFINNFTKLTNFYLKKSQGLNIFLRFLIEELAA